MTLTELLEEIGHVDQSDLAAILTALAARLAMAKSEALSPPPPADDGPDDAMLSSAEAAVMLNRSVKWLYRRRDALPFARKLGNRSYVFSRNGLQKWLARQRG